MLKFANYLKEEHEKGRVGIILLQAIMVMIVRYRYVFKLIKGENRFMYNLFVETMKPYLLIILSFLLQTIVFFIYIMVSKIDIHFYWWNIFFMSRLHVMWYIYLIDCCEYEITSFFYVHIQLFCDALIYKCLDLKYISLYYYQIFIYLYSEFQLFLTKYILILYCKFYRTYNSLFVFIWIGKHTLSFDNLIMQHMLSIYHPLLKDGSQAARYVTIKNYGESTCSILVKPVLQPNLFSSVEFTYNGILLNLFYLKCKHLFYWITNVVYNWAGFIKIWICIVFLLLFFGSYLCILTFSEKFNENNKMLWSLNIFSLLQFYFFTYSRQFHISCYFFALRVLLFTRL